MGQRGIGSKPKWKIEVGDYKPPWLNLRTRADRVIAFLQDLTITSGTETGKKLKLRLFQKRFIRDLYAEKKGHRKIRTAILSMARKNGKTQLAAGLALCHLCGPEAENRGEVYACANDRFQAGKIYNEMEAMINCHPWLLKRTNCSRFMKSIEDLQNGSTYSTLTSEAKTKMGLSPSFVVYDELGQSTDRELYDAMDSAMGARAEPLMLVISTQAADNAAPLSHLIDYGLKVQDGSIDDPAFHLTFYHADDDADPWDPKSWEAANPALGDFRSLEDVKRLAHQAQRIPTQENAFRNLILNQRVAMEARFMDPTAWKKCEGSAKIPPGEYIWGGVDLGSTRDLSSLACAWQERHYNHVYVNCHCWAPGNLKDKGDAEGAPYEVWAKQGYITPAGAATDPASIALKIAEINMVNPFRGIAVDRWRVNELKRELDKIGCPVPLIEHGQGFKDMSPAVDLVDRLVQTNRLRHGGNPVLTWCANNAVVLRDSAGGRKFDKSQSKYRSRIDALQAMAMALSAALIKDNQVQVAFDVEALIG